MSKPNDPINPNHYKQGGIEVIDFLKALGIAKDFCKGNAIKYIARAGIKDPTTELEDFKKAAWYANKIVEIVAEEQAAELVAKERRVEIGRHWKERDQQRAAQDRAQTPTGEQLAAEEAPSLLNPTCASCQHSMSAHVEAGCRGQFGGGGCSCSTFAAKLAESINDR